MEKMTPELLASAGSVEEVGLVCQAGADAVVIGSQAYALRAHGDFDLPMIQSAVDIAHGQGKKVYVLVNALLHHDAARQVPAYIGELHRIGVDAIVFGDPAVLMAARQVAPAMKLHWNTEMTSTNYRTVQYWAKKGAKRAVLAASYDFAGLVLDYDPATKMALIEQRNHFRIGQEVEFISPTREKFTQRIEAIWDEQGNQLEEARHAMQKVNLRVAVPVQPYDIMRKEK